MKDPIDSLQDMVDAFWIRTGLDPDRKIPRGPPNDGSAHVECHFARHIDNAPDLYDIVVTERGNELQRLAGLSALDASIWFLFRMATRHAQSLEVRLRRAPPTDLVLAQDNYDSGYSRWNWMAPTIQIMNRMSPALGDHARADFAALLRDYPLSDREKRNAAYPLPDTSD